HRTAGAVRADGLPRVKASMARVGPKVSASRMLREYTTDLYEPAARRTRDLRADGDTPARECVAWTAKILEAWPTVEVTSTAYAEASTPDGTVYQVTAQ